MKTADVFFLNIPVYRLDENTYYKQRDKYINQQISNFSFPETQRSYRELIIQNWGMWQFNEIIGFIRLFFCGYQLRGQFFKVSAKRIVRTRKKQFRWESDTVVSEILIPPNASSNEIRKIIELYIKDIEKNLQKIPGWKQCYLDTENFLNVARYISRESFISEQSST